MVKVAVLGIILAGAAPAMAQTAVPPAPAPTQAAPTPNPLDKVVCKTEDTLGTRLGAHRVCATVREWKDQEEQNRTAAATMQGAGAGCSEMANGSTACRIRSADEPL
jgi:hypothetical protein